MRVLICIIVYSKKEKGNLGELLVGVKLKISRSTTHLKPLTTGLHTIIGLVGSSKMG